MNDDTHLRENTRRAFVLHAMKWPCLRALLPALLEIAEIRFSEDESENWPEYWRDVWRNLMDADDGCGWISPRGNVLFVGFGHHVAVCNDLFHKSEEWVEQRWVKVTRVGVFLGYVSRPTQAQITRSEKMAREMTLPILESVYD